MIILLLSTYIKASAQSPYAIFGDDSKMLEAKSEPVPSIYRVGIQSPNGANFYADFDLNKGLATLYDVEGNILRQDSISEDAKAMFTTMDPLCEKYYHVSPYAYCLNNPIKFIDPDGQNPIYDMQGNFLGTDNTGLQGYYFVMDKENFTQGMSNIKAGNYAVLGAISSDVESRINEHYNNLPNRPDYDGFVTVDEGISWAKSHPNALKNPTPDNMLYIDTSQLDFGYISTSDFPKIGVSTRQNLFSDKNTFESLVNPELMATVYALGRVNMILTDRNRGTVKIVNDEATDYDWNVGGGSIRNTFIQINNTLFGINPQIHGFKTFYYGIGTLRK